jgi:hypothetical protein
VHDMIGIFTYQVVENDTHQTCGIGFIQHACTSLVKT